MEYQSSINEIVKLLVSEGNDDIQYIALQQILGFTGPEDSATILLEQNQLIDILVKFSIQKEKNVAKLSILALINLSRDENCCKKLLHIGFSDSEVSERTKLIPACLENILDRRSPLADSCCMLLCNLTRTEYLSQYLVNLVPDLENTVVKLVDAFCDLNYNTVNCNLDYLGPFFSNISQSSRAVGCICHSAHRLIPFAEYKKSNIRRGGIIAMLQNISFRTDKHLWLLSTQGLNILPSLLLPLAGPEEFPDDEMEKLPIELQYLPNSKEREPDPDIKIILLKTLLQLCCTSEARNIMRDQNVYIILRELHKNEKDREVLLACENVVDILIRTEEEIGVDKLNEIDVPDDLKEKFEKMDRSFLEDL